MRHSPSILMMSAMVSVAAANPPPLLPEAGVAALANELSGETAKRNLEDWHDFIGNAARRVFTRPPSWWPSGHAPTA